MALTIKSIYSLWALCSDLVFVILFPQLLCAIYVPFVNTYGSVAAYCIGLILRLGGGEAVIGLPPFIKYPLYDEKLKKQLFPFRTLAMLVSLLTLILVSLLFQFLFKKCELSKKLDLLQAFELKEGTNVRSVSFRGNNYEEHRNKDQKNSLSK